MTQRTLYQILMVDAAADTGIITLVYHALAKRYHSARAGVADAGQRMVDINAAYAILSDPDRRAGYDLSIGVSSRRSRSAELVAIPIETRGGPGVMPTQASSEPESPYGEAGPPPPYPLPNGSVMTFGRYRGWAISQIDGYDPNYLEWLRRTPTGRAYTAEIDAYLERHVTA